MSAPEPATDQAPDGASPPSSSAGEIEVLALVAAGELASFARLADDAAHAPELRMRITLSRLAAGELAPLGAVEERARALGADPEALDDSIWSFRELLAEFDARLVPRDWWERLVKTYIGYGIVLDLQRELAAGLTGRSQEVAAAALADKGWGDVVVAALTPVIAAEPQLAARLALWGRRVVGEGLGITARLLAVHPEVAALAAGAAGPWTPEHVTALTGRLTSEHARRMKRLDLTA
ncbi:ferritin-like fold-containing protein [Litorihabitans aurantiacus]|uniref:Hydroxylase n=1 Tax=Litorihabitans aurantiacus TaxID=1930061 RepID=A0AA37XFB6_9MICO|nr:ferritin-like fold-containing protein [Litorihabitans aurantiacus]GMA32133.1 hydroxylase [Litorihabitans aurantiacus]